MWQNSPSCQPSERYTPRKIADRSATGSSGNANSRLRSPVLRNLGSTRHAIAPSPAPAPRASRRGSAPMTFSSVQANANSRASRIRRNASVNRLLGSRAEYKQFPSSSAVLRRSAQHVGVPPGGLQKGSATPARQKPRPRVAVANGSSCRAAGRLTARGWYAPADPLLAGEPAHISLEPGLRVFLCGVEVLRDSTHEGPRCLRHRNIALENRLERVRTAIEDVRVLGVLSDRDSV